MIIAINRVLRRLRKDDKGATAIEYGLIAALISVAIIAGATSLGSTLNGVFTTLGSSMSTANNKAATYSAP